MDKKLEQNSSSKQQDDEEIILYSENYNNTNNKNDNSINNPQSKSKSQGNEEKEVEGEDEEVMLSFEEYYLELCRNGDLDELINLMKDADDKFDPNLKDQRGNTAMHMACGNGHLNIVKYLITNLKCDINVTNNSLNTPLSWASLNGQKEIVKFLVDNGANIEIKNNQGKDPSEVAYDSGNWDISEMLIGLMDKSNSSIKEEEINEKEGEIDEDKKDK